MFNFICFMRWVTKRNVRIDYSTKKAKIVLSGMLWKNSTKAAIVDQGSQAFTKTTAKIVIVKYDCWFDVGVNEFDASIASRSE